MMQAAAGFAAQQAANARPFVDDVFSAYTYTGNGATQTITNGIDLAGKGGMVWIKDRNSGAKGHALFDTARGVNKKLQTQSTNGEFSGADQLTAFNATGFDLGSSGDPNGSGTTYVSWTFRKAPKFFDVVTYTGDGTNNRSIAHSLGQAPGMIVIKRLNDTSNWGVYHQALGINKYLLLNTTAAAVTATTAGDFASVSSTDFVLYPTTRDSGFTANASGITYVAYLFAHDTSADGIIQCGSFTTDGSGSATVNLGWEPQFLLMKNTGGIGVPAWVMYDSARSMNASQATNTPALLAYSAAAESTAVSGAANPNALGFNVFGLSASATIIYLAIRRPNKPPTTGTQVYNAIARTGTGAAATVTGVGFAPDLLLAQGRSGYPCADYDRLRGSTQLLRTNLTNAEYTGDSTNLSSFGMDGVSVGADASLGYLNSSAVTYINHFFRRAPGVFDEVCYTGDGTNTRLISYNLGVTPEMLIFKSRNNADGWATFFPVQDVYTRLDSISGKLNGGSLPSAATATSVDVGNTTGYSSITGAQNNSSYTYVAYLFATKAGISKVGSYTGNGTNQTINCGFTTGARFVLIKRTDAAGDWYIWDSVRGIVAGNDPHLSLNTTAAEVTTDDSVDTDTSGFIVNQLAATNINVTSATYIFLAIA